MAEYSRLPTNPVDDGYEKSIRAQRTHHLDRSTEEFKREVEELVDQYTE